MALYLRASLVSVFMCLCVAWDIAVTLMEVGEVARVKTSARFAYGEFGKPPSIPGNAALTYELELLEVHPPLLLIELTEEELVELV